METSELNLKNLKPLIFIVVVLILSAISAYPQRNIAGKVVEVIDGKTCVVEIANGKLTVVLQYIETPESGQPLYQTVKDHLQALILDKTVELNPRGIVDNKTIGQLWVKGVDVSEQMLRDGAAWYALPEKDGQAEAESLAYQEHEKQAKAEKRGVWSVENLKPSWEFRAEQAALAEKQRQEMLRQTTPAVTYRKKTPVRLIAAPQTQGELWADVGGANAYEQPIGAGGLLGGYNPTAKIGHISTPSIYLNFPAAGLLRQIESRVFYIYKGDKTKIEDSIYLVGFIATAKDYKFVKSNNLVITADGEKIAFGKAARFWRKNYENVQELLVYKMKRAQLMKLVKAEKITVQIGNYNGEISAESLALINNLLNAS